MPYKVEVDGTTVTQVIDVDYETGSNNEIGGGTITVANTGTNRSLFESGSNVVIKVEDDDEPGTFVKDWQGEVIGKPSNADKRNLSLEVDVESKAAQAEYGKVGRPFIEKDSGAIVREMFETEVDPYSRPRFIHRGSSIDGWSSNASYFERGRIRSKSIYEYGNDIIFFGLSEGSRGWYRATYDGVPERAAPGRRILEFETRLLANNDGNVMSGEVELRDYDGISYVWDLDLPGYGGFETYKFAVEDAEEIGEDAGELTGEGKLEYRFRAKGGLPESRAVALDMARTTPFRTTTRESGLSTDGVEDTGRTVTRRFDKSILEAANDLAVEDGAIVYVDTDDVVHYETEGDVRVDADLDVVEDETRVVDVEVDRDYDDIRNRVQVQGKDDIQATFEDTSSIDFYNVEAAKEEPIIDTSLRTEDDLEDRARGYLSRHAWEDSAIVFTIADRRYRSVNVGNSIGVNWPSEDLTGTYIVAGTGSTTEGYVTLRLRGNTSL